MALITSGLWFESFNQVHSKLFKTQSSLREFFVEADADKSGQVLTVAAPACPSHGTAISRLLPAGVAALRSSSFFLEL